MSRNKTSAFLQSAAVILFSALFAFGSIQVLFAAQEPALINIGILKADNIGGWDYEWQETFDFLKSEIPEHQFKMLIMSWDELEKAIVDGTIDFVIASPLFSLEGDMAGNLTVLATLKRESEKIEAFDNLFGSVIFWRSDNKEIKTLWDVRNKALAAGPAHSIGGWLAAAREFAERGIDLRKACRTVNHYANIQKIIDEVLSGHADFGICRTSSLELLARDGKFDFKTINFSRELYMNTESLPFACSTRLYPEWSFARTKHIHDNLAERVNLAILKMSDVEFPKKLTWGIAANYAQVYKLMQVLNLKPFSDDNSLINSLIKRFKNWLAMLFTAMLILGLIIFYLIALNKRLRNVTQELDGQRAFFKHLIDSIPDYIFVKDFQGRYLSCNKSFAEAFSCDPETIAGKTDSEIFPDADPLLTIDSVKAETGINKFSREIELASSVTIFAEIIKVTCKLKDSKESLTVGIIRDISVSHRTRQIQAHREKLISGIAEAAHLIVGSETSVEEGLPVALNTLATAVGADRMGLIKLINADLSGDKTITFECFPCNCHKQQHCDRQTVDLTAEIVSNLAGQLTSGNVIGRNITDYSQEFQTKLCIAGIKSLLVVPIFVHKKFWGCLDVQVLSENRNWLDFELSALKLAADIFGSMIERSGDFNQLVDYRDRLKLALDSAGLYLWEYDFEGRANITPDDLYRNLGHLDHGEIDKQRSLGFGIMHPDDMHLIKNIADAENCQFEVRLKSHFGKYLWHSFIGRNYFGSNRRHIRLIGFFRNTTAEHTRDLALRMEEGRNMHALAAAHAASWEYVPEERRFYWSNHIKNLLGYNPEIFSPNIQSVYQVIHPDDLPAAKAAAHKFLISGRELRFECRLRHFDGTYSWFVNIATQVKDPELADYRYYGIIIDISETRALQQNLLEARNRAEEMAQQAQLANQAKTEFLANMSHEIRTPMNGILGMLEILMATSLNQRQKDYAELIYRSSHSLLGILNAVLDLSKIEAGKLVLEPVNLNLRHMLGEIVSLMQPMAEKKKIEIVLKYPPSVPENVVVDGGRLRQVLINLLSNAIKFTEEGFISLEIKVITCEDSTSAVFFFEVKDTGIGMNPAQQKIVFEKFSQADSSITRRFGGTGLGLTICLELVKLMGGEITLESAEGLGTKIRFSLKLPLWHRVEIGIPSFPAKLKAYVAGAKGPVVDSISEILASWNINCEHVAIDNLNENICKETDKATKIIAIVDFPPGEKMPEKLECDHPENITGCIFLMTPRQVASTENLNINFASTFLVSKPVTNSKLYNAMIEILNRSENITSLKHKTITPEFAMKTLVVEDNEINKEVARGILEMFGCTVTVASSGAEALEFLDQQSFDVVFLDCQMPVMDGFEVVKRIRTIESLRGLPVIAMTAHSMPGDREKCLTSGMNDFLAKPVDPDLLQQILRNIQDSAKNNAAAIIPILQPETSQVNQSEESCTFDSERIKRIFSKKPAALAKIVEASHDNFYKLLNELNQNLSNKEYSNCPRKTHTIKGSAANLGGNLVAETAQKLEEAIKAENETLIQSLKDDLEQQFKEFYIAIKELSEQLSKTPAA